MSGSQVFYLATSEDKGRGDSRGDADMQVVI